MLLRDTTARPEEHAAPGSSTRRTHARPVTPGARAHQYRPDIDGLRAIAVLSVLGFHAFPGAVRGGFVGVDMFFVISGFLISTIIFDDLERERFSYLGFYARRIRRIFPALAIVMATCLAFGWFTLLAIEYLKLGKHVVAGAGFVSNISLWREVSYFDNASETKPLLHLWSLGIEEQFYIFWPLLLSFAWKRRISFFALMACIALASFAVNLMTVHTDATGAFYSPLSRFWELMMGGMLAYVVSHRPHWLPAQRDWLALAGLVLVAAAILLLDKTDVFPGWLALLPTTGALLLIAASPDSWINRHVLGNRVATFMGLISYPLYLWHWPLLSFANILDNGMASVGTRVALIAASFVLAVATWRLIERPLRSASHMKLKVSALCASLLVLACMGGLIFHDKGVPSRATARSAGSEQQALDAQLFAGFPTTACHLANPRIDAMCVAYNADAPGKLVVVWGDSHAGAWSPVFFRIARDQHLRVIVISHLGCPPLVGTRRSDGAETSAQCSQIGIAESAIDSIRALHPAAIALIGRWSLYSNGWMRNGRLEQATHFVTTDPSRHATRETSRAALASQLPATVDALKTIAPKVIVFDNPPVLRGSLLPRAFEDPASVASTAAAFHDAEDADRRIVAGVAAAGKVAVFDPAPRLCDAQQCRVMLDGVPVYDDDNHVSVRGAMLFEQQIASLL